MRFNSEIKREGDRVGDTKGGGGGCERHKCVSQRAKYVRRC